MSSSLELSIENKACDELHKIGCTAIKHGRDGYPDRLVPLGAKYPGALIWIEFKTNEPGSNLRPGQKVRHRQLRAQGQNVVVCRSWQEALGEVAKARRAIDRTR